VISIALPTLSERKEDILELSLHFLKQSCERLGRRIAQIDDDTLEALKRYPWPGNIRELENVIERAVVLMEGDLILPRDLPREVIEGGHHSHRSTAVKPAHEPRPIVGERTRSEASRGDERVAVGVSRMGDDLDEFAEREALENALRVASGNKAEAARMLGLPRSTFFSKLRKYHVNKPR